MTREQAEKCISNLTYEEKIKLNEFLEKSEEARGIIR